MTARRVPWYGAIGPLLVACLVTTTWADEEMIRPGVYEITAQLVMPHLEENLRSTATTERQCLPREDLSAVFSVLRHPSLAGCDLGDRDQRGDAVHYRLRCENPQTASGLARLDAGRDRIVGVLEVKMGGKNMTFFQRIEGTRKGECDIAS